MCVFWGRRGNGHDEGGVHRQTYIHKHAHQHTAYTTGCKGRGRGTQGLAAPVGRQRDTDWGMAAGVALGGGVAYCPHSVGDNRTAWSPTFSGDGGVAYPTHAPLSEASECCSTDLTGGRTRTLNYIAPTSSWATFWKSLLQPWIWKWNKKKIAFITRRISWTVTMSSQDLDQVDSECQNINIDKQPLGKVKARFV